MPKYRVRLERSNLVLVQDQEISCANIHDALKESSPYLEMTLPESILDIAYPQETAEITFDLGNLFKLHVKKLEQ